LDHKKKSLFGINCKYDSIKACIYYHFKKEKRKKGMIEIKLNGSVPKIQSAGKNKVDISIHLLLIQPGSQG
jgi:hypothetical protein